MTSTKICATCKAELPFTADFFHKNKNSKSGLHGSCKACRCALQTASLRKDPELTKKRKRDDYLRHRDKYLKRSSEYHKIKQAEKPPASPKVKIPPTEEQIAEKRNRYRLRRKVRYAEDAEYKERIKASTKKSRATETPERKAKRLERNRLWWNQARKQPRYLTSRRIRARINDRLKNGRTGVFRNLPYTVDELVSHIEAQFTDGMNWSNYGRWHIDHIIPDSAFDYQTTDDLQFQMSWSLSNLRPLWARDNIRKADTLNDDLFEQVSQLLLLEFPE